MEKLKEEIYKLVASHNLTKEEMVLINTYINNIVENFTKIESTHQKILNDKDELNKFKQLLLKSIEPEG
jgi:hypothetical protein